MMEGETAQALAGVKDQLDRVLDQVERMFRDLAGQDGTSRVMAQRIEHLSQSVDTLSRIVRGNGTIGLAGTVDGIKTQLDEIKKMLSVLMDDRDETLNLRAEVKALAQKQWDTRSRWWDVWKLWLAAAIGGMTAAVIEFLRGAFHR